MPSHRCVPALHRYCCRLTGNVWDGEDLMQDALLRVFGLLGKIDRDLENPKAYFIRTATHLWIDQQRRLALHRQWQSSVGDTDDWSGRGRTARRTAAGRQRIAETSAAARTRRGVDA